MPKYGIPLPDGRTPAAESYMMSKAVKDATISPAYAALKDIQVDTGGSFNPESSSDVPLATMFKNETKRYFGGEEYKRWNKTLAAQQERGLLVELLQNRALQLAIAARNYQMMEKREAILAALVAAETRRMASGAREAGQQAIAQELRSAMK